VDGKKKREGVLGRERGKRQKYDIRSWSPGREKCGKGITLTEDEAKNLFLALKNQFQSLS